MHPLPTHPSNTEPAAGAAVSVRDVPTPNDPSHAAPQSIPAGALVTRPPPEPLFTMCTVPSPAVGGVHETTSGGVNTSENRRTLPVAAGALSDTLSTHIPSAFSPANAASGC